MLRSIATKIMVSYVRASMGANVAAIVAVSVAIGVLAAVINTRSAVQGTEVGEAVTVNVATNAAISWTIASLFCIPQIVGRAFRKFDYFLGCLHLVGWPARRSCQMLSMQLLLIMACALGLSYPVAALFQRVVMQIPRRDSNE